jgi:uncharacterized membrane protein YhaH (DUF805 family)
MSVVQEVCPSCAAPLTIPENIARIKCPYCATSLAVQQNGSEVALALTTSVAATIEQSGVQTQAAIKEGAFVTQAELRRLQVAQDLSMAQMRLVNVQGEIRSIERLPLTAVSQKQLRELRANEADLQHQIKNLTDVLYPPSAPASPALAKTPADSDNRRRQLPWLLFSPVGRATRGHYWLGVAILFVIWLFIALSSSSTVDPATGEPTSSPTFLSSLLIFLFLWIGFAVSAKRYHDRGKAAWWVLVALIPVVGFFWQIVELGFLPGDPGPNQYSQS